MSLKIGIVGLPNAGKSSLFKALTGQKVNIANYPFATIDPNVGVVKIPDERLEKLAQMSQSKKVIPAAVEFVDIAGLVKGAHQGAGLGNQFLSHIREVDAIVEVVREFEDPDIAHVEGAVNPKRDLETINLELAMADLETIRRRLEKIEKEIKNGSPIAQEQKIVLEKIKNHLEATHFSKVRELPVGELKSIADLNLLTLKPRLLVFNSNKNNASQNPEDITMNLKSEAEIADLPESEAKDFKKESRLPQLIKAAYEILNLITYFTTGEDETRAWTIKRGWSAPRAGSAIHTDFETKFIKAEVINWQDLLDCGSWANARQKGKLRIEGRDYVVQDGDVIEFKI